MTDRRTSDADRMTRLLTSNMLAPEDLEFAGHEIFKAMKERASVAGRKSTVDVLYYDIHTTFEIREPSKRPPEEKPKKTQKLNNTEAMAHKSIPRVAAKHPWFDAVSHAYRWQKTLVISYSEFLRHSCGMRPTRSPSHSRYASYSSPGFYKQVIAVLNYQTPNVPFLKAPIRTPFWPPSTQRSGHMHI